MSYIGQPPFQEFANPPTKDSFTGDGSTTTFDMNAAVPIASENALEVYIDNVRQEPGSGKAFTLGPDGSGDQKRLTFSAAPANGASIYVINDKTNVQTVAPVAYDLNGTELILDGDADTSITADSDDRIDFLIAGTDHFHITTSSGDTVFQTRTDAKDFLFNQYDGRTILEVNDAGYVALSNGATGSGELRIYEDTDNGSNYSAFKVGTQSGDITYTLPTADGSSGQSLVTNGSGVLSFSTISANTPTSANGQALGSTSLEWSDLYLADGGIIYLGDDQDTTLTHVADTGILLNSTRQLQFGDSGTYIHQSADGVLDLVSDTEIEINATTVDINGAVDISGVVTAAGFTIGSAVIAESELEQLDGITAGTVLASKAVVVDANKDAGTFRNITLSGELDAATLDISGNADIDGTTNLDEVDIDGAVQIDGATTFGVDDTGVDVKFFGATSGAYLLWDESQNKLLTAGGTVIDIVKDKLMIGSTAVTTTAAELNLLDGVSGLVQADFTKLAAVDSTAAELNIVDGGTSATSTTVADADRVVMNDNGTMVQVAVTDLAAYFDDEITAMPNLVTTAATTVGALDSGSITSGFGNIDNGASNITSGGLVKLDVDADADDVSGDSATGRLTIGAGEDLNFYHGGTNSYIVNDTGDLIIKTGASDEDFIIKGNDGGSEITPLTLDMSAGGDLFLTGGLIDLKNDGSAVSQIKFYCESSNAHAQTLIGAPHSESATNTLTLPSTGGNSYLLTAASTATVTNKTFTSPKINEDVAVTATATEINKLDGVGTLAQAGKHTIWVPANAMTPTASNGCSILTTVETTSGRPDMNVLDFDKDSDEFAQFSVAFPKSWNAGTITFQFFWSGIAATTGVAMNLQGVSFADNDSIDTAYGTAVVVQDDAQGAVEELLVSAESGAVTIAGSPGDNELCYFRIGRDVSDGNDDMAGDCRLHGVKLFYTTDAANDA